MTAFHFNLFTECPDCFGNWFVQNISCPPAFFPSLKYCQKDTNQVTFYVFPLHLVQESYLLVSVLAHECHLKFTNDGHRSCGSEVQEQVIIVK